MIGLTASINPDEMAKTAAAMRRRLVPLLIGSYEFDDCRFDYAGASFGITSVDPAATSLQAALKAADQLMYADKEVRRGLRRV
ncbi:putative diguanylate cyclase YeaP [compost metagenome]